MIYQIDQSGKIEQTHLDTVISLTNKKQYSLLLAKKSKRLLQNIFRKQGRPRMFIYLTFAALVAIILKEIKPERKVLIDDEYTGHQDIIKKQVIGFLRKMKVVKIPKIEFGLIGKSSPAHKLAAKVAHKKAKSNKKVTLEEILKIISGE